MNNTFFSLLVIALAVVALYFSINELISRLLLKVNASIEESEEPWPPDIYNVNNITFNGIYPIVIGDKVPQKFRVEKIQNPYFLISVFTYSYDTTKGIPPVLFFYGWTDEILSNYLIESHHLLREPL